LFEGWLHTRFDIPLVLNEVIAISHYVVTVAYTHYVTVSGLKAHLNCCFCSDILSAGNSDAAVFLRMLICCNMLSTFTIMVFIWLHAELIVLNRSVLACMMVMDVPLQLLCLSLNWTKLIV